MCVRILQKLAGDIDHETLGKLLPENLLEPLEEQYLSKQQVVSSDIRFTLVGFSHFNQTADNVDTVLVAVQMFVSQLVQVRFHCCD